MKRVLPRALLGVVVMMIGAENVLNANTDTPPRLHTVRMFEFVAAGSLNVVGTLLGADRERAWAPGWSPSFVWPAHPRDQQGMVFTTARDDGHTAIWVNTVFDPSRGQVQYAYVVPDVMVTLITLHLKEESTQRTHVAVTYERTALKPEANEAVQKMADHDAGAGPEWGEQINDYLARAGH
jgi:hypothetical protein